MIVTVEVPDEIFEGAARIARSQSVTVEDLFAAACAQHVAAWRRIEARAARADRSKYLAVLAKVPNVEPEAHDRID